MLDPRTNTPSYPASAGDWAFPHNTLACWQNVPAGTPTLSGPTYPADQSIPGDVIAEAISFTDASGHVGFVVGPQQTVSGDSAAACVNLLRLAAVNEEAFNVNDSDYYPWAYYR
jgi:hypothetical protein